MYRDQHNYQLEGGWVIDRVHNSRRSLDRLQYVFVLCDAVILTFDFLTYSNNNKLLGEDSWWTIPMASLMIVVTAVLVSLCG